MCGIAGGVWSDVSNETVIDRLGLANTLMHRRGPDDSGHSVHSLGMSSVGLGHARLSIIDLSSDGHQPMVSACGRYEITFNGEIYNYKELAAELEMQGVLGKTQTDTEVLLNAWVHWGEQCLPKLIGMFAFAVLDTQHKSVTLVRDAFGIKPLFYCAAPKTFVFASTAAAVNALTGEALEPNFQIAYEYLVHGRYDQSKNCFFRDISQLSPSGLLVYDIEQRRVKVQKLWRKQKLQENKSLTFDQAVQVLRNLFLKNVELHMRSDVPVGVALSGGIDSTAIVCAIRHVFPDADINTFSFIARGSSASEEYWVDLVNKHVGAKPHKVVVDKKEVFENMQRLIDAQGEPFGSTSIYAGFAVFQEAKKHGIKVLIEGQGADELLAGYHGYPGQRLRSLLAQGRFISAILFLIQWGKWPGRSRKIALQFLVAQLTQGRVYHFLRRISGRKPLPKWINKRQVREWGVNTQFPDVRSPRAPASRSVMAELAVSLYQRGLPALLRHSDRNSMYFSIESRVPFLTLEMADFLLGLPEEYLISRTGETKSVFRAAMRGIVPDEILDRRDKVGFETPESEWVRSHRDAVLGWVHTAQTVPLLEAEEVAQQISRICDGKKAYSWQVWRWINFIKWYQHFMPGAGH